ncbi:MAG: PD-(D/E)XK nuclease family protein [Prosthecobacter sp.]|nr:PD-(D/E)XK nuclease family protein [Prosthecobacter sp.]
MMSNTRKPNLFDFATSELSQDAFICWLLSWASPEHKDADSDLHEAGSRLIRAFFQLHAREAAPVIETVRVERQPKRIDVLCIVNDTFYIVIEDKTGSSAHSNQLTRYVDAIRERGVSEQNIIPIYFKTHEESGVSEKLTDNFKVFSRSDLLKVISGCSTNDSILLDFHDRLSRLESDHQSFRDLPVGKWGWFTWQGFFQALQIEFGIATECWKREPNVGGGFWGFRWAATVDPEYGCEVYLQLEDATLTVRVGGNLKSRDHLATVRLKFYELINRRAPAYGLLFKKAKFLKGARKVAKLVGDYRILNEDGILDFQATVHHLKRAQEMVQSLFTGEPSASPTGTL